MIFPSSLLQYACSNMELKQLWHKDIPLIIGLERDNAPDKPLYKKYDEKALNYIFDNPEKCKAYGVFEENKLIGWGAYRNGWSEDNSEKGVFEISSIVVNASKRGQGIGKMLLDHITKEIQHNANYQKIYLTVSPLNVPALSLYIKNGFVIYDYKPNVYGEGAHRVYLVKSGI